jgi:hypothetical protein
MGRKVEVWFYIGALLGFYGVLLTAAGVYQWIHPPVTVLSNYHATFWAGVVLLVVGGAYTVAYWPRRGTGERHNGAYRIGE